MSEIHHVLLVPGFFGFGKFGEITYFGGVERALTEAFERLGKQVEVTEVITLPTASIRQRAARVLESLAAVAARSEGPIHIVGHSTGGLDARLAIAPTASLPTSVRFAAYERVRSLVTVCCPHFGTPVATFFSSAMGKPLLRLLALYFMWLLRRRFALAALLWIGYAVVRARDPFRRQRSAFDEVYDKLLRNLSESRRVELIDFLEGVSSDQSLLFQLTPAGCDLLNACTADPAVRYGSVVARAKPVTFRTLLRSLRDLYAQLLYPIYALLRGIAGRGQSELIPAPVAAQEAALIAAYGELPSPRDNDGIVPTRSQIWGELVHAAEADHLDVVGQYGRVDATTWGADWIPSFTGFDGAKFAALWSDVARFVAADEPSRAAMDEPKVGTERTEQDLPKG